MLRNLRQGWNLEHFETFECFEHFEFLPLGAFASGLGLNTFESCSEIKYRSTGELLNTTYDSNATW